MTRFPQIIENNIGYRLHDVDQNTVANTLQGRAQLVVDLPLSTVLPFFLRVRNVDADNIIARLPEKDHLTKMGAQP
ncbi:MULTISPECIES: hypothetical protein [Methylobacterium]|jgi:hypothetical protein|uniref:hypothetical protein n=1 Tax=Methylobacterium TaxID=407 RepID=UPI000A816AC0|nr:MULTISPECIES: hypothetical protein [Methylobacterium]NGM37385.1 hypothetical protein [Methylobacterium sp. DB0501]UHC20264.1 hypothetical protein LRS73_34945 [Methylobacterium currus]